MQRQGIKRRELTAMLTAVVMSLALVIVAASGLHSTNKVITELKSKSLPDIRVALGLAEGVAQLAAFAPYAASVNQPSLLDEQNKRLNERFNKLLAIIGTISDPQLKSELDSKLKTIEKNALQLGDITSHNLLLSEELLSHHFQLRLASQVQGSGLLNREEHLQFLTDMIAGNAVSRLNLTRALLARIPANNAASYQPLAAFLTEAEGNISQQLANDTRKQFLLVAIRVQSEHLSRFVNGYVNDIQQQVLEQQQRAQSLISRVFWGMVVMVLLLILAVATNYGINVKIVRDLTDVTDDMIRLSNGDTRKVSRFRQRNDEIGDLLNAYQVFRTYTYRIQKVSSDLEQQKLLLESIFDGMHDGLSVFTRENRLLTWNKQYLKALKLSEKQVWPGMPLATLIQAITRSGGEFKDLEGNRLDLQQWIESRHSEDRCVEWCDNSGTVIEFRSQPMGNGGFITLTQDLTYRRETEHQLQQAVKMEGLGQLTGGVSHDFNNFLTAILGNLELLELQQELSPRSKSYVIRALRATESGRDLVHKLLAFSRKQVLTPEVICAETLIRESSDLLAYSVSDRVALTLELASEQHFIQVDKVQLQNALLNLVINANGAINDSGTITLRTQVISQEEGDWLDISVSDTGKGIPLAIQHRVFEAFFTTKGVGEGSGLGLSSVHGYVEQSGGRIGIESEPGKGTVIWMRWPLVRSVESAQEAEPAEPQAKGELPGVVVLVEDDEQVAQTMLDILASRVGHVVHFPGADQVTDWVAGQQGHILAVLSDVHLAKSASGVALRDQLRERFPALPVYLYSGMAKESIEQQFNCVLGNEFISKPVTLAVIERVLSQSAVSCVVNTGETRDNQQGVK